jgi:hypothetical protein
MLQIGFGQADITPSAGMNIIGGFIPRPGKGVRDRCWAVACVVHDGSSSVALVGTDTLVIGKNTVMNARRMIQRETKIPGDHVLVGASHTHSGGPAGEGPGREENAEYLERLSKGIAQAVAQAWHSLHASEIGIGTGKEASISFNRRFLMRNGREITHPGKPGTPHHAEIVRPAGPIDPDVGILAARDPKGRITGIVVNFACHCTVVGGDLFSPDYPAYLRRHLQARYGEIPVVFLAGACGDITQVDNMSPNRESGPDHADMMGMKLAAETQRTINQVRWLKEAPVAVTTESAIIQYRPEPDVDAERPPFGLGSGQEEVYARGRQVVAELRQKHPRGIGVEVMGIRIGPLGIASNGSEYFCEYGLRTKACSPFETTWVVELANEALGYIPTAQAFMGGGYEVRTGRASMFAVDAGQRVLEKMLAALGKVAPLPRAGGRP